MANGFRLGTQAQNISVSSVDQGPRTQLTIAGLQALSRGMENLGKSIAQGIEKRKEADLKISVANAEIDSRIAASKLPSNILNNRFVLEKRVTAEGIPTAPPRRATEAELSGALDALQFTVAQYEKQLSSLQVPVESTFKLLGAEIPVLHSRPLFDETTAKSLATRFASMGSAGNKAFTDFVAQTSASTVRSALDLSKQGALIRTRDELRAKEADKARRFKADQAEEGREFKAAESQKERKLKETIAYRRVETQLTIAAARIGAKSKDLTEAQMAKLSLGIDQFNLRIINSDRSKQGLPPLTATDLVFKVLLDIEKKLAQRKGAKDTGEEVPVPPTETVPPAPEAIPEDEEVDKALGG